LHASLKGGIDKVILAIQMKQHFQLGIMIGIKDDSINAWETAKYIYNNPRETAEAIGKLAYNLWMYYDTRDLKYIYPISVPLGNALYDKIQKEVMRFNEGDILDNSQQLGELVGGGLAAAVATKGIGVVLKQINLVGSLINRLNVKNLVSKPASEVNRWWKDVMGYENPPYLPGSSVVEFELVEDTNFVRVYDGVESGKYGGWLMKAEDIKGLSAEEIRDKFALPAIPKYIVDVKIKAGTKIRSGITNEVDGWGAGGGIQYDLMGQRVGEFYNERVLK
jgi:hypothetical protein